MDHSTLAMVGGMVVHKVSSMAAGAPIKALLQHIRGERTSDTLNRVFHQQVNDIALEWPANLQRLEERLATEGRDLRAELRDKLDERQATILFLRMLDEAIESAARERLTLMCAGMAGVFTPELDVETKSRVVRAVAMLEPSDVAVLKGFAHLGQSYVLRSQATEPTSVNWHTLRQAGCISVESRLRTGTRSNLAGRGWSGPGAAPNELPDVEEVHSVTELGESVLLFLATHVETQGSKGG